MLKQAVKNFEKALEINPDAAESWYMLSELYRFIGNDVKAANCHDRAAAMEALNKRGPSPGRD
jgi:Tfp pilus assembly protein PilF